ncbi:MAG: extracellular solute-binding protein, partial [Phormidesmis sp. CAN_BIN36]|nr:extracellular solute-binding protein [Phormidesmis sp. CAN_BIN36]
PPTDWSDLWRDDLRGHISLLDQPREVIGLTLKRLGQSYNTIDLKTVPSLEAELRSLHQQVKFYSSDNYLQPMLLGDTWAAVGWSTDALPLMQRNQPIGAVFPLSGTALWSDLWVHPATSQPTLATQTLLSQWINFCWTPEIAAQLSLLSDAASPILTALNAATLPKELQKSPLLLPSQSLLDRSEFLEPLPKSTVESYQSLWEKVRQAV